MFRHRVVATGEHIHGGVTTFGPGMNGDMGFGQQGESGDALGLEVMGDQVEKGRTGFFRCRRDAGSQKGFIVEPAGITLVKLEDAMFADHVGGLRCDAPPSRVGMQFRQALLHRSPNLVRQVIGCSPLP